MLKEVLCKKRHVKYILLDGEDNPDVIADSIIAILKKGHLYIDSDPASDVAFFRKRYLGLMNKLNDAHI